MTLVQFFQEQLEAEAVNTRKMLSIVPDDQYDWRPHPKSMTIRSLATHIAELPTWFGMTLNTSELDFATNPYQPEEINNTTQLLEYFERNVEEAKAQLAAAKEEALDEIWTLRSGEQIFLSDPKRVMLRITFSQMIHHRAQLGVFLRLLNIPIPGSYGPSADEMGL